METVYENINWCSGCGACKNICSFGAIQISENEKGFFYPIVIKEKCKNCQKCKLTCQACQRIEKSNRQKQMFYTATHKDEQVLCNSQSGGAFTAISDIVLDKNGVIYGCVYDINNHRAIHSRATTKEERDKMCGSKYIQSDIGSAFVNVKEDLQSSKVVLFTGTPCQCDALKRYLESTYTSDDNLLTVDIICHGVASPLLWKEHIAYLEKKYKGHIDNIVFRDKSLGWSSHFESFWINGKKRSEENFKQIFYSNLCLSPSCYECAYADLERFTDITIGDAWRSKRGTEKGQKGESLIIINSAKGQTYFEQFKKELQYQPVSIDDYMQLNLIRPSSATDSVEAFWKSYKSFGYPYILFVFGETKFINKCYRIIRSTFLKLLFSK